MGKLDESILRVEDLTGDVILLLNLERKVFVLSFLTRRYFHFAPLTRATSDWQ